MTVSDPLAGAPTLVLVTLPEGAPGRWCLFRTGLLDTHRSVPFVELLGPDGETIGDPWFLVARRRGASAIGYVPEAARRARVAALGRVAPGAVARLRIQPIGAALAALRLLAARPKAVPDLLRSGRSALARLATARNRPEDYGLWIRCFEPAAPAMPANAPSLSALVFHPEDGSPAPLAATLQSLGGIPHQQVGAAWPAPPSTDYIALLQAGEILPPFAAALAAAELIRLGQPAIAIADTDALSPSGTRHSPEFRPEPNHALMLSGTLSRGLWLVRRDAFLPQLAAPPPRWAELCRLELWLRRYQTTDPGSRRIPYILSHRRPDTGSPSPTVLAATVDAHLAAMAIPLRTTSAFPLRLTPAPTPPPPITLIIPSTLHAPHTPTCILDLLAGTTHPSLTLIVIVAQPTPLDPHQQHAATRIASDPRTQILHLPTERFNFAEVCNRAAALAGPGPVCFVNDDVTPLGPGWLAHMQAHLADPRVGIVGARLEYPDGSLQHGGVIMGVGGLCEHAHRHLPGTDPGYAWRASIDQEVSAVTAACMLVRRPVFDALGGFDIAYPSAYNDIDLCLRAREAGHAVVLAAGARLIHHELQTYGSHYEGDRAPARAAELARMRHRWASVIAADPFHSPNLSLAPGREWRLAFPPRVRQP